MQIVGHHWSRDRNTLVLGPWIIYFMFLLSSFRPVLEEILRVHLSIDFAQWAEPGWEASSWNDDSVWWNKPTLWFHGMWMWLNQNGVWWAARAWLMWNHCVDCDFLFTDAYIFRLFVFEAETVSHFFALFCYISLQHSSGQTVLTGFVAFLVCLWLHRGS